MEPNDDLAPRLKQALQGPALAIPPETDAFLVDAARMAARRIATRRRRRLLLAAIPAAAAVAALALFLAFRGPRDARDVNGDGRFDILDAFALARTIERGGALRPEWDFNHGWTVDRADVDQAARQAVELPR